MKNYIIIIFILTLNACVLDSINDAYEYEYASYYGHEFNETEPGDVVVFIGDSRIDRMKLDDYFNFHSWNYGTPYKNAGQIADDVVPILAGVVADKYVVSCGLYDYNQGRSVSEYIADLSRIIDGLLLYTTPDNIFITTAIPSTTVNTTEYDEPVRLLCLAYSVNYINLFCLESSGYLAVYNSYDGQHLNIQGLRRFAATVGGHVEP